MRGFDWQPVVYMLVNRPYGMFYFGVTNDLESRIVEHLRGEVVHTRCYGIKTLVWFEAFERMDDAIAHEKRVKRWRRSWKIAMVERDNPEWLDLAAGWALPA